MNSPRWWRSSPTGILIAILTVMGGVLALDLLFSLMELAAKATAGDSLLPSLLRDLPDRARRLLAECCLIGAVWYMGSLAQHGELGALRSLGVSSFRICLLAAIPACVFAAAVLILAETATGNSEPTQRRLQWAQADGLVLLSQGCEQPLHWWQISDTGLHSWGNAQAACHRGGQWQMRDVQLWQAATEQPRQLPGFSLIADEPQVATERANPRHMRMSEIWQLRQSLAPSRYRSALMLEFWQRLLAPLKVALLVLLATLLPLAMLRDSRPGVRLLVALGLALGFHLTETLVKTLGQNLAIPPLLTTAIPLAGLGSLYWLLLRRHS